MSDDELNRLVGRLGEVFVEVISICVAIKCDGGELNQDDCLRLAQKINKRVLLSDLNRLKVMEDRVSLGLTVMSEVATHYLKTGEI